VSTSKATPKRVRAAQGLYQRPKDGAVECGFTHEGRWRMHTLKGAQTLTEAKKAQRAFLSKLEAGETVAPSKLTVGQVASELLASLEAQSRQENEPPGRLSTTATAWIPASSPRLASDRCRASRRIVSRLSFAPGRSKETARPQSEGH
jgi:hypothetical protein